MLSRTFCYLLALPCDACVPHILTSPLSDICCRPHAPKECQRQVEPPELLMTACSRQCKNGHCTPTGKCCCSPGWEGPLCRVGECLLEDFQSSIIWTNVFFLSRNVIDLISCVLSSLATTFDLNFILSFAAKCEPACRNGGVCMEPNKCLCKSGYSGAQCEKSEGGMPNDQEKDGILDHIIDMTSYILDLTSYIV